MSRRIPRLRSTYPSTTLTSSISSRPSSSHLPLPLPLPPLVPRPYATLSSFTPPPSPYNIFDEPSKTRQRTRALLRLRESGSDPRIVDYVREEVADRLAERIEDLRIPPKRVLDVAGHAGQVIGALQDTIGSGGGREWMLYEASEAVRRDEFEYPVERIQGSASDLLSHPRIQQLREQVDAVVSGSGLHWVGDIVGALTQIRHVLKPDGVFVGAVLGGDTLFELRTSLQLAEQERRGGIANRISPMISPTDGSSLLSRAGFTLTTVDVEDVTVHYPSIWELMSDLRDMGESNAILGRRAHVSRDVLLAAEGIYNELYGTKEGIPATFQMIFLIGWKPGPTEPKPLERGSGTTNLKDVL